MENQVKHFSWQRTQMVRHALYLRDHGVQSAFK